jgi:hypothetical protein
MTVNGLLLARIAGLAVLVLSWTAAAVEYGRTGVVPWSRVWAGVFFAALPFAARGRDGRGSSECADISSAQHAAGESYGPFDEVCRSPAYLTVLNLHGDDLPAVRRAIARVVQSEPECSPHIRRMLESRNWRPQLVALAAALSSPKPSVYASDIWATFDRGSWVAPQLAATLYLTDPDFAAEATRRVAVRCPLTPPRAGSSPGSAKNLGALLTLLARDAAHAPWVARERESKDVQQLLREEPAPVAQITEVWCDAAVETFAKRHRPEVSL